MSAGPTEPARLPPAGLDGLDPSWSRLVTATCADGDRTFHVLDSMPDADASTPTLLCVHGNPSWSYLWRGMVPLGGERFRVVAVDHLDMGFSERTGTTRRLADRVDDLTALTNALGVHGRVITLAHDWGGPISLGWALAHRDQLDGVILTNTAVHQPAHAAAPRVIRATRRRSILPRATIDTTAFITGALEMSRPRIGPTVRDGFLAPYRTRDRRHAIGAFVEDIPLEPDHPTAPTLDAIAAGLDDLGDVPALLLWGARDPVFSDLYLHDLESRLPHAAVHRWPAAGHFVTEDAPVSRAVAAWLGSLPSWGVGPGPDRDASGTGPTTLLDAITDAGRAEATAVHEMTTGESIDFGTLARRIDETASALLAADMRPGDRVAIMIPPGIDLIAAVYGAWRAGLVVVLVDGALTPKQMTAALRSANPAWLVGIPRALAASRALRWPGTPVSAGELSAAASRALGDPPSLPELRSHAGAPPGDLPRTVDLGAVVFTSGSTGPSKGVLYTHGQLAAQRDAIATHYGIDGDDSLVAAFAPFALYGPMLGITSVVPDMDVSAPSTLTAAKLADAVAAIDATMVFASPGALENIVRTSNDVPGEHAPSLEQVRILLSAGAPVRASLLADMATVLPNAVAHTPYGMTECLPVASISLPEIEAAGDGDGVCVGPPLPGVEVRILPLAAPGSREEGLDDTTSAAAGEMGEIAVRAAHLRERYDRLWLTTHDAQRPDRRWHRTGDVGHLDSVGRLWVSGRAQHVLWTARDHTGAPTGALGPVGLEKAVEQLDAVHSAAVVGVGPTGDQRVVVVVQSESAVGRPRLAPLDLIDAVRGLTQLDVVAVLDVPALPVDRRHNSKIDRSAVAEWAANALAGGRIGAL